MMRKRALLQGTGTSIGALFLGLIVAGCGGGGGSSSGGGTAAEAVAELQATGFAEYLGAQAPSRTTQTGEWTNLFFDPAEEGAICLVGDEFQLSFRDGPSDDVLLYLQGGGACWDYVTCHVLGTAFVTANGAVQTGIIDITNPDNPFKDFDIVYVPYCDGSIFVGDATVDYNGVRTYHHGLRNLSVAVDAMLQQFPHPSRIVVAGSSAGGYGTFPGYGATRVAFPETPIIVFNDSGPGVQNHAASDDVQNRSRNWNFERLIPESCTDCDRQFSFLLSWAFERDAMVRTALYSYQEDGVISFFIDLSGPAYRELVRTTTDEIKARDPDRFARYFPTGSSHTVLLSPEFYTQTINGVRLLDWTRDFLSDGEGWEDVIE